LPAVLAIGIHLALAAFLIIGVRWQIRSEQPVSVELWNQAAAPQVESPPPERVPVEEPSEPPPPAVEPPPPRPEPAPVKPAPVVEPERTPSAPDIALERERRKRAEQERRAQVERENKVREEKAREERAREERAREERIREEKARDNKLKEEKAREDKAREQRQREDRERIDRQAQRELQEAQRRKLDQQLAAESAQVKADIARREAAQRASAASAGDARARDGWISRISGKIRGNLTMPENLAGNPQAIFEVVQLPTGEVISVTLRRSSGVRTYDEAVERAIYKSSPLPRPDRPDLFVRELNITFKAFED
jgi:colicin import membrane protein